MNLRYLLRRERDALLRRLELAVDTGVLSAHDAVEVFVREAPIVRWLWRGEMWQAFDRLYDAWYYRTGLSFGYPDLVARGIGPAIHQFRRSSNRNLTHADVAALLVGLFYEWSLSSQGAP